MSPRILLAPLLAFLLPQTWAGAEEKVDFGKQILPVLEARCMECHRTPYEENGRMRRPKGGLVMDTAEGLLAGGGSGDVLIPGNAAESYLVEVVHLPEDDDMFMPPKRSPLSDEELKLLTRWVNEGADMGGWQASDWAQVQQRMEEFEASTREELDIYDVLAQGKELPAADVIGRAESAGARVSRLAQGSPLLRVDFLNAPDVVTPETMAAVAALGPNVVQLELGRTSVNDAALEHVKGLPNLVRLDLHQTAVTDAGLASLSHLEHLNYLNLYGTGITDAGLQHLGGLASLQRLYLWQSKVTPEGAASLQEKLAQKGAVSP